MQRYFKICILIILFFSTPCHAWQLESQQSASFKDIFNIVFVPLDYPNNQRFLADVTSSTAKLKQITPFNEFEKNTSIWHIELSKTEQEILFKSQTAFPYLSVRRDFLEKITEKIKSPYKLVIINSTSSTSSAELSSADKTSLIILGRRRYHSKNSFVRGFLHELGHSFGLRDESLHSHAKRCAPGPPNCATSEDEARKWWGDLVGKTPGVRYIKGCCGERSNVRPTSASLMNDPDKARSFGPVNERYIREALQKLFLH